MFNTDVISGDLSRVDVESYPGLDYWTQGVGTVQYVSIFFCELISQFRSRRPRVHSRIMTQIIFLYPILGKTISPLTSPSLHKSLASTVQKEQIPVQQW